MTDHAAELRQWFGPHPATEAAIAEIARLRAENERFRATLEPFATFCAEMDALPHCAAKPDEAVIHWPLTVGAFRAARSAWEGK
jgi:hypothetical protein